MKSKVWDLSQQSAVTVLRFLYPIWTIVGLFSIVYVPSTLIVSGNAIATAKNILANEFLFRLGIAGSLTTQLIHIIAVVVLYKLFEKVSKSQSAMVVILGLVGVPIAMLNTVNQLVALSFLKSPNQMMFFLNMNEQGILIAEIFWGLWLIPLGYLIYKSGYFPKIIGILVMLSGIGGYTLHAFTSILFPQGSEIYLQLFEVFTTGELIFMLWVMFMGANLKKKKR